MSRAPDPQPGTALARPMPKPSAQVQPYVDALGAELAVLFLIEMGGAEVYLAATPKGKSQAEALVGAERLAALARHPTLQAKHRVPLANEWLARMLHWQGRGTAEIARQLRLTDTTVRRYIAGRKGTANAW